MKFEEAYVKAYSTGCTMYRSSIFGMVAFLSPENELTLAFVDPDTNNLFITSYNDDCYGLTPRDYAADDWEVTL